MLIIEIAVVRCSIVTLTRDLITADKVIWIINQTINIQIAINLEISMIRFYTRSTKEPILMKVLKIQLLMNLHWAHLSIMRGKKKTFLLVIKSYIRGKTLLGRGLIRFELLKLIEKLNMIFSQLILPKMIFLRREERLTRQIMIQIISFISICKMYMQISHIRDTSRYLKTIKSLILSNLKRNIETTLWIIVQVHMRIILINWWVIECLSIDRQILH